MAYAALASLSQTIDLILRYLQDRIFPQLEDQIKSIHESVKPLLRFVEDSPDTDGWVEGRITEVIHEAEDIVEILSLEQIYRPSVVSSRSKSFSLLEGEYQRLHYGFHDLERVSRKIESINCELTGDDNFVKEHLSEELVELLDRLTGGASNLKVIAIVGMGGIGKTSLARKVYDDPLIKRHFDICGWATVSQDKSVAEIVSHVLVSMGKSGARSDDMNLESVYKTLFGRRYLVVLDDIWDTQGWDDIKRVFPNNGNGSRIIVTTRLLDVACYVDSCTTMHIRFMDEDQSWSLLRQKVFKGDHCPLNIKYIGQRIARMCRGHPLAISLVSGILAADLTKDVWESFAENLNARYGDDSELLLEILTLSYTHLPHHLRPCFLYMAAFPEDCEIHVSKLVKLWVAEGFLEGFEEIAEEYLEELVQRNLVLVTKWKSDGRIKCVSVHDLVRDVCLRKAQEEDFFRPVEEFDEGINIPRRVTIVRSCDLSFLYRSRIHALVCLKNIRLQCSFGYFRLLRILDLSNACPSFPVEIFELFHLRYLAFDGLFNISTAISNLRNLQTLIISSRNYDRYFVELPGEIWRMPQLRHLVVLPCVLPRHQGATFALENLYTLSNAVNLICSLDLLRMIPNLKKLGMFYTEWRDYKEDYELHNLIHLRTLEDLKIEVCNLRPKQQRFSPAFPQTLRKLTLSGLGLPWTDMEIVGSLPYLEVLKLRKKVCVGETWETTEGKFPKLKFLLIENSDLQFWISESSHFPKLRRLVLRRCWNLTKIPDGIGDVETLELIEVDDCNESLMDSAAQILEDQQSFGNDGLQISILRNSEQYGL